jgi:hypothetical protein
MRKATLWAVVFFISATVYSQSTYDFLRNDISPRAASLAGSYVSTGDDPNVIFYNPAGINLLSGSPLSFSFLKYLMDINSASLAFSKEIVGIGRFGAGIEYINYGTFTGADDEGNKTGDFGAGEMAFLLGYGNQLDKNFYYGANIKLIYSSIAGITSSAIALDLGLHYAIPESRWNFGFSVLNLGSQLKSYYTVKEDLPLDMRLGFSKEFEKFPVRFFWSFNSMTDRKDVFIQHFGQITAGGELRLGQSFKIRFGYDNQKRKDLKIGNTAGLAGVSLGFGFIVKKYNIDYSYSSLGSIGGLHRFGVSTNLDIL